MDNLELWRSVEKTDPAHTKAFSGKGGFSGTAISPMYLIRRATEQWGPMGGKWGIRIVEEKVVEGAPILGRDGQVIGGESVHMVQAQVYYPLPDGGEGNVPCFGQTQFVGMRGKHPDRYPFTDEEAPKKSLTDALTKGLSWLGFAADVHMGMYDDNKYMNRIRDEFEEQAKSEDAKREDAALREKSLKVLEGAAKQGRAAFEDAWRLLSNAARQACKRDLERLKAMAPPKETSNAAG